MAISLPTTAAQPLPQTPVSVEILALRAGQVVEARVTGEGQGAATQLSIGSQLVDAALSVRLQSGTLIQLLVEGVGPNKQFTVLPSSPQGQGPQAVPAQPQASANAAAQPQTQTIQLAIKPGSVVAPAVASSNAVPQTQPPLPPGTPQQTPNAAQAVIPRPTLVPSPGNSAPAQVAAPQSLAGVVAPPVAVGSNQNSPLPAQLEPGTVLRFQLQGSGANARTVLVVADGPNANAPAKQAPILNVLPVPAPNPLQQAVAQMVQNAVVRQDSITTLLASLAGLGEKLADLPKPVAQAGAELLAGRLNLSARPLDGAGLRQALIRSGVLFENTLQKSGAQPLPQADLKAALLNLRTSLLNWLGSGAQSKSPNRQPPPPPTPGVQPRSGRPSFLPLPANLSNTETGARLLGQAEAALARIQLTQLSSLPESTMRAGHGPSGPSSQLNVEVPLMFAGELNLGQFQIFKDGDGGADGKRGHEWKLRFSLNFSQTGEVGATVTLRGGRTGVMLWAEREETAAVLKENQGELEEALVARGLEPGAIRCRRGSPPQTQKPAGAFMDNCS